MQSKINKKSITFCEELTKKHLTYNREHKIWMSWYPIMERILSRTTEMEIVYDELCASFGHSVTSTKPDIWLTLETIWSSGKTYNQESITHKREVQKKLIELHEKIPELAKQLSEALKLQNELLEKEGFSPDNYINIVDIMSLAGQNNGHYYGYLQEELEQLDTRYDLKYWPDVYEVVGAIAEHGSIEGLPVQRYIPKEVMRASRAAVFKDYVLAVDSDIKNNRQITNNFNFSNKAMANIVNVVLDISEDQIATEDTIRNIRNRFNNGDYKK